MEKRIKLINILLFIFTIISLITTSTISSTVASNINYVSGFEKGPSYTSVIPNKEITFVKFDEETLVDDYAYLSAIPTSVFNSGEKLFSHPLIFYQDEYDIEEEKEITLDAKIGIDYFMEDWMSYCDDRLDALTLINVKRSEIDSSWKARNINILEGSDPYSIADDLALYDWSYSNNAVIAVIDDEFTKPDSMITNKIVGTLESCKIKDDTTFELTQTNMLNPVFKEFYVDEKYKYLKAEAWWDGLIIAGRVMIPTGDPDIQIYCKKDGDWMQASAAAAWNVYSPIGHEYTQSYVYNAGDWKVGITDFPTEGDSPRTNILGGLFTIQGSILGIFSRTVTYNVDITMYPGITLEIPDNPPFGCGWSNFTLRWDNPNVNLGFTIIGPGGEAIFTMINETRKESQEINLGSLGECLQNEHYSICVFGLDSISTSVDFEVEYSIEQKISKEKSDSLTSATEGAVLASQLNAPLLYVNPKYIKDKTKETLYTLGVEHTYLVDIGNHLEKNIESDINYIAPIEKKYTDYKIIYDDIRSSSGSNDVVFSTLDPWTYWYLEELKPADEMEGALFLGPAAYLAAHHGCPVTIIDNHPRLSSAVVWHDEFWRHFSSERYAYTPSVAEMVLTGRRIYDFMREYGFDQPGEETIITVADQFDIGIPWDRVFPGAANSGRFCGSPVDISYWISRSVFYPALIFVNPALTETQSLINGSTSSREGFRGLLQKPLLNTLAIKRESEEESFEFSVLCSFVTHKYRFNERASQYFGSKYQCADGLIPGETSLMDSIDQGVNLEHYGQQGAYFPDISETEIVPFYLNKGGYDPVFSTELESVTNNLNEGVILWVHASHGSHKDGGKTYFWDPSEGFSKSILAKFFAGAKKELNPWRGYDWLLGSTEEPDTMSMDIKGILPFTNYNPILLPFPATGMDWVLARKPIREFINKLILPRYGNFPFNVENLYDGLTGTLSFSKYPLAWKTSEDIEDQLDNIHSMGFITSICQTSNTYLHLMMIRHGSVFQVQDPWPTSWYGAVWRQSIPRDIILGYTTGEAYSRGISHVGTLYLDGAVGGGPQWWWDTMENVIYFGDPDLRMYVPDTTYSDKNHWDRDETLPLSYDNTFEIDGHMLFGATEHTQIKYPKTFFQEYIWIILAVVSIIILIIFAIIINRKNN